MSMSFYNIFPLKKQNATYKFKRVIKCKCLGGPICVTQMMPTWQASVPSHSREGPTHRTLSGQQWSPGAGPPALSTECRTRTVSQRPCVWPGCSGLLVTPWETEAALVLALVWGNLKNIWIQQSELFKKHVTTYVWARFWYYTIKTKHNAATL